MALKLLSHAEQVAAHLRTELMNGRWRDTFPGVLGLARELGVNPNTMEAALRILEAEGFLFNQGRGRPRLVRIPDNAVRTSKLRIAVMNYGPDEKNWPVFLKLFNRLHENGFEVRSAPKSLKELGMNPRRIARVVAGVEADAWIVQSGSREVLEWFARQPAAVLAYAGRHVQLPVAGVRVVADQALMQTVRRLHETGHRRIVVITEALHRLPNPSPYVRCILDEMQALGLAVGRYNLPDWNDTPNGLLSCLDQLFKWTPPDALFIDPDSLFVPVLKHLLQIGIQVPQDVSLVSAGSDAAYDWFRPIVSRIEWDYDRILDFILRWARSVERGKPLKSKHNVTAAFIEGGTIRTHSA